MEDDLELKEIPNPVADGGETEEKALVIHVGTGYRTMGGSVEERISIDLDRGVESLLEELTNSLTRNLREEFDKQMDAYVAAFGEKVTHLALIWMMERLLYHFNSRVMMNTMGGHMRATEAADNFIDTLKKSHVKFHGTNWRGRS